jgi:hypothetical protein
LSGQNYEERYLKDDTYITKGLGLHSDLGYSTYQIELKSSELSSAIDYDVLEYTLGLSYVYGEWMFGGYSKFLVDEVHSNMFISSSHRALNNRADITKRESVFYLNHTLLRQAQESLKVNLLYRQSTLKAGDTFLSFYHYWSYFEYETKGVALSLVYSNKLSKYGFWFVNGGVLYTEAQVKISEMVENRRQDVSIEDTQDAMGVKIAMGYSYNLSAHLTFNLRADGWRLDFHKLDVRSLVGDRLPLAGLKEQSITTYMGLSWRF